MFFAAGAGAWWCLQAVERSYVREMSKLAPIGICRVQDSKTSFELAGSNPRVVVLPTTEREGPGVYRDHWVLLIEPLALVDASLEGRLASRLRLGSPAKPLQTDDEEFNARFRAIHPESASRLFARPARRRVLIQLDDRFGVDTVVVENEHTRLHLTLARSRMNAAEAVVALRLGGKLRDAFGRATDA